MLSSELNGVENSDVLYSGYFRARRWSYVRVPLAFAAGGVICIYILIGLVQGFIESANPVALIWIAAMSVFFFYTGLRGFHGLFAIVCNRTYGFRVLLSGIQYQRIMFFGTQFVSWKHVKNVAWDKTESSSGWILRVALEYPLGGRDELKLLTEERLNDDQRKEILERIRVCRNQ